MESNNFTEDEEFDRASGHGTEERKGLDVTAENAMDDAEKPDSDAAQEIEEPIGDEDYGDHFRKTFITENQGNNDEGDAWTLHDMMIPGGQTAKLVRVSNPRNPDFRISEVADRLKFV